MAAESETCAGRAVAGGGPQLAVVDWHAVAEGLQLVVTDALHHDELHSAAVYEGLVSDVDMATDAPHHDKLQLQPVDDRLVGDRLVSDVDMATDAPHHDEVQLPLHYHEGDVDDRRLVGDRLV